jgi:hypothetical protein
MADVDMTDAPGATPVGKKKSSSAADGESKGDGKKRFEVKKVSYFPKSRRGRGAKLTALSQLNAVALWAWDIVVDNCAICRNHIMDLCMYART